MNYDLKELREICKTKLIETDFWELPFCDNIVYSSEIFEVRYREYISHMSYHLCEYNAIKNSIFLSRKMIPYHLFNSEFFKNSERYENCKLDKLDEENIKFEMSKPAIDFIGEFRRFHRDDDINTFVENRRYPVGVNCLEELSHRQDVIKAINKTEYSHLSKIIDDYYGKEKK